MRPLSLLAVLLALFAVLSLAACVHTVEVRDAAQEYGDTVLIPNAVPQIQTLEAPALTVDEGSGGFLPRVPYYVANELTAQAEAPVGSPSWLGNAYSLTLSAPSGVEALKLTSGSFICGDRAGCAVANRLFFNGGAWQLSSLTATGTIIGDAAANTNGFALATNGARVDLGTGAGDYLYSDGAGILTSGSLTTAGYLSVSGLSFFRSTLSDDSAGTVPLRVGDVDGLQLSSTAALPTCAAALEGTIKRDGTTGAASTARTRMCLCTSDGAATPAYAWINAVSGTVGTATTCPL